MGGRWNNGADVGASRALVDLDEQVAAPRAAAGWRRRAARAAGLLVRALVLVRVAGPALGRRVGADRVR